MPLSTSDIVKPSVTRYLTSLKHLASIAQQYCIEQNIDESALLNKRIVQDMHPLIWQFQMVTEFTLRCTARMAELPIPELPFNERTFNELITRIDNVIDTVEQIDDSKLDGSVGRNQTIPLGENVITLPGKDYLIQFFLPNFHFHITTVYAILRGEGLNIGKQDFVGDISPLFVDNL